MAFVSTEITFQTLIRNREFPKISRRPTRASQATFRSTKLSLPCFHLALMLNRPMCLRKRATDSTLSRVDSYTTHLGKGSGHTPDPYEKSSYCDVENPWRTAALSMPGQTKKKKKAPIPPPPPQPFRCFFFPSLPPSDLFITSRRRYCTLWESLAWVTRTK